MKNKKGITLIALVVTIIVLLILAGVTLALVSGENGILRRATNAVDVNEKASAEEEANLLIADFATQYYEEKYVNNKTDLETVDESIKIQLKDKKETQSGYDVKYNEEIGKIEVSKNEQIISSGPIENGKVDWMEENKGDDSEEKTLVEQIKSKNYGDKVNYSVTVNGKELNNWKIFYKDEEKSEVIMILGDYLPNETNLANEAGLIQDSVYNVHSNTNREELITKLQTNSNWEQLLTKMLRDKGAKALGAVDLETWVKSWNAKEYVNLTTLLGEKGFYIGNSENPTTTEVDLSKDVGYGDKLYFPYQSIESTCVGYWLSSPSAGNPNYVVCVTHYGSIDYGNYYGTGKCCLRPIIHLPNTVLGEQLEDGSWNIK